MLDTLVDNLNSQIRWVCLEFNQDEDLVLMSADGRLFIIDIVNGDIRDKSHYTEFAMNQANEIDDTRLEGNTLVVRTKANRFAYLHNIVVGGLAISSSV